MKRAIAACIALCWSCAADGTKTGNGITMEFGTSHQALSVTDDRDGGTNAKRSDAASTDGARGVGLYTTDASGASFFIETATMAVTRIELRTPDTMPCSALEFGAGVECDADRLRIRGAFELDLLARAAKPSLDLFELPTGTYTRVDVDLERLDRETLLGRNTFAVAGHFEYQGQLRDFRLALERNETMRFESPSGALVEAGQSLLAAFDVAVWFEALPIIDCLEAGELELTASGLVITEASGCSDIENAFVEALRRSTELNAAH